MSLKKLTEEYVFYVLLHTFWVRFRYVKYVLSRTLKTGYVPSTYKVVTFEALVSGIINNKKRINHFEHNEFIGILVGDSILFNSTFEIQSFRCSELIKVKLNSFITISSTDQAFTSLFAGHLINAPTLAGVSMALLFSKFAIGFTLRNKLSNHPSLVTFAIITIAIGTTTRVQCFVPIAVTLASIRGL